MKKTTIPVIFSCLGALGAVATGALATYATIKAVKLLEEEDDKSLKDIPINLETGKRVVKCYILPISAAVFSAASIFVANGVNRKTILTLAGGVTALSASYKEYMKRINAADPELNRIVCESMGRDHYVSPWGDDMGVKVIFHDQESGRTFERAWYQVSEAFYHFNRNFQLRGYGYLNELYDFLDIPRTENGYIYGWYYDYFCEGGTTPWIDYITEPEKMNDGTTCNNIIFWDSPMRLDNLDDSYYSFYKLDDPGYYISPC